MQYWYNYCTLFYIMLPPVLFIFSFVAEKNHGWTARVQGLPILKIIAHWYLLEQSNWEVSHILFFPLTFKIQKGFFLPHLKQVLRSLVLDVLYIHKEKENPYLWNHGDMKILPHTSLIEFSSLWPVYCSHS